MNIFTAFRRPTTTVALMLATTLNAWQPAIGAARTDEEPPMAPHPSSRPVGWQDPAMVAVVSDGRQTLADHLRLTGDLLDQHQWPAAQALATRSLTLTENIVATVPYLIPLETWWHTHRALTGEPAWQPDPRWLTAGPQRLRPFAPTLAEDLEVQLDQAVRQLQEGRQRLAAQCLEEGCTLLTASRLYLPAGRVMRRLTACIDALEQQEADTTRSLLAAILDDLQPVHSHAGVPDRIVPQV